MSYYLQANNTHMIGEYYIQNDICPHDAIGKLVGDNTRWIYPSMLSVPIFDFYLDINHNIKMSITHKVKNKPKLINFESLRLYEWMFD